MKKTINILGFTSFIVMYLTVGAIQSDNIPFVIGIIICFGCLALLGLAVYISKFMKGVDKQPNGYNRVKRKSLS